MESIARNSYETTCCRYRFFLCVSIFLTCCPAAVTDAEPENIEAQGLYVAGGSRNSAGLLVPAIGLMEFGQPCLP